MLRWSVCALFVAVLSLAAAGGGGVASTVAQGGVFISGQLVIESDENSQTTVITVDADSDRRPADGRAEHAFRVQQPTKLLSFRGFGTLSFQRGTLSVWLSPAPGSALAFTVLPAPVEETGADVIPAAGLAHFYGSGVSGTAEDVRALLFAGWRGAVSPDSLEGCGSCQEGGSGWTYCEPPGPSTTCSADCMEGYYACCNAPSECRCCREGTGSTASCRVGPATSAQGERTAPTTAAHH
jgi:hypothetical protein